MDIDGYTATFTFNRMFKTWQWRVRTPDGRSLAALVILGFVRREKAEADALDAIEADARKTTVSGNELRRRVHVPTTPPANPHS